MRILLICAFSTFAYAADPVTSAWIRSRPAANAELRRVLPDVHEVVVEENFVEVRSAGLSLLSLGTFQNPLTGNGGVRDLRFRIPRKPVLEDAPLDSQRIGPGEMGVFLNGVPLYNRFAEASYMGRNMWHFDTLQVKDPAHPLTLGVLQDMIANGAAHSPLLGFALDGFPIYGPWGFANADGSGGPRRMRSGYRLRKMGERTRWPDGTVLTPSQYGPPVNAAFPLGTFAEDYLFAPLQGDLDASNGRFSATPDYPQGTYAYFLTTDDSNQLAFPYFLTERFRGKLPGVAHTAQANAASQVQFTHDSLEAGKPTVLNFAFPQVRYLEIVHEKPLHLMAVSDDLQLFDHIHPEWRTGNFYAVTHTFRRPGHYRLFAQFTRPGEPERLETFDVTVLQGSSPIGAVSKPDAPLTVTLLKPGRIQTGQDLTFTVELSGEPVEPYLGAWGHFVFLDHNLGNFIHAHPTAGAGAELDPNRPHIHGVSDVAIGPPPSSVSFTTNFARAGRYKLWAQFQVAGKPVVVPFEINVADGAPALTHTQTKIPPGAIAITVDARGFTPARIDSKVGKAVTLAVTRADTPNCGSQIVFPSLGIKHDLPLGKTTLIELPEWHGELAFTCGMGMYRGLIVGVAGPGGKTGSK
jgi:hypothetical protein